MQNVKFFLFACLGLMHHGMQNQMKSSFMKARKRFIEILENIGGRF